MTHVRITIDGTTEFDGSVTEWARNAPDKFRDMLAGTVGQAPSRPAPHMTAIMLTFSDAVQRQQSVDLDATTNKDGWTLEVKYR